MKKTILGIFAFFVIVTSPAKPDYSSEAVETGLVFTAIEAGMYIAIERLKEELEVRRLAQAEKMNKLTTLVALSQRTLLEKKKTLFFLKEISSITLFSTGTHKNTKKKSF